MDNGELSLILAPVGILCLVGGIIFMRVCKTLIRAVLSGLLIIVGAAVCYSCFSGWFGLPPLGELLFYGSS